MIKPVCDEGIFNEIYDLENLPMSNQNWYLLRTLFSVKVEIRSSHLNFPKQVLTTDETFLSGTYFIIFVSTFSNDL